MPGPLLEKVPMNAPNRSRYRKCTLGEALSLYDSFYIGAWQSYHSR